MNSFDDDYYSEERNVDAIVPRNLLRNKEMPAYRAGVSSLNKTTTQFNHLDDEYQAGEESSQRLLSSRNAVNNLPSTRFQEDSHIEMTLTLETEVNEMERQIQDLQQICEFQGETLNVVLLDKECKNMDEETRKLESFKENQQLHEDLRSVEQSFSDLNRRYQKLKSNVHNYQVKEDELLIMYKRAMMSLCKEQQKYQTLKAMFQSKINSYNEKVDKQLQMYQAEVARQQMTIRKLESKRDGMEILISQTTKENNELTSICDDLIGRLQEKR